MSIIIRLQNLPLSAKASDIRDFFSNLKIPKGAVIYARLAMRFEGKLLHDAKAKAESFSGAAAAPAAQSSNSAGHTQPFADIAPQQGLKKDVSVFNFGLQAASIAQITGQQPPIQQQQQNNSSSNGDYGNTWNNGHSNVQVNQQPPSDSWKTSSASSYPAFQPSFLPPSASNVLPAPQQQPSAEQQPKLFYSNNTKTPMDNPMYQQHQHESATAAASDICGHPQQPSICTQQPPPFSPPFAQQQNPHSGDGGARDEARAHAHSYQQHFDSPGGRQTGPPPAAVNFGHAQYPPAPHLQQPRNGQGMMGNGPPPKAQPFQQQHTYEQQQSPPFNPQQQPPVFTAAGSAAVNTPWMQMYPPPANSQAYPNAIPEQKNFRNMSNDNGQLFGQALSRIPTELLRPANLEAFLSPTVPLTLSSVKVVHNPDGSVLHALVKFGCEEDAKRILHRNGDRGIKVSPSSETNFNNAMDGILGAVAKPMATSNTNKRLSPPAFPNNNQHQHAPQQNNDTEYQAKRGRRDAPAPDNGNNNNKDRERPAFNPAPRANQYPSKKERICVQLTNVPYKATYDNIRDFVCTNKNVRYEKITRTYYTGKNLSDRWIVEFSNDRDASSVCKSRAEILGRRIHGEYVSPRAADDQYAIPEPDENRDRGNQQRNAPFQPQRGPPPPPVNMQHQAARKRDSHQPDMPNMTLEASTLDELITRGDLPPTSFGAFQSAVVPQGVLRRTGGTSKIGVGNQFKNNVGPNNNPPFNPLPSNINPPVRGADYQPINSFPHRPPGHQTFVPPPSNFSRAIQTKSTSDPKFRPNYQTHDPAVKSGLLPHPPNSSKPNELSEEEPPVPLFSIKFQNGLEKGDPRKQPSASMDSTLNSTCDSENGRLMIADDSAMSSASGLSIAASAASSSVEKMSPYYSFLERARENENGNRGEALHFLGVQLDAPSENIARMPDGSLHVNLSNEELANKAASRNGAFLERNKIFIQQISRTQMAEAIRTNLLNAPKPSEHALVARGFEKSTTANQVASFFEKFHPLTVSLMAADKNDNSATFLVSFTDAQECGAALMILNNTKHAGNRQISLQMRPVTTPVKQ
uniref:RRM domain-containing protein n=1 Tax=Ditylenchus dipsaci TaxID=166011 RepID=A0A915E5R4_9BILA